MPSEKTTETEGTNNMTMQALEPEKCYNCNYWRYGICKRTASVNYGLRTSENCWCDQWSER